MCTLALAYRVDRRWPIVVAANRDERRGRASEPWALREPPGAPRYAAPRDLVGGGTWIGVSSRGVFAALTNHFAGEPGFPDPERRSRGELVVRALASASAAEARAALAGEDAARWNPFHLVVADATTAFVWAYDGHAAPVRELGPGLHVVTETEVDGQSPRAEAVRARWPLDPDPSRLQEVLARHAASPREAVCVHLDARDYGTRSAAVLRLAPGLALSELWTSEAPPCLGPLEDRSRLLADLARAP